MIKFFRKIRKKLLTENKFSKYILYAVGEIILVIIGILIALQINNQNEAKKIFNSELQLYANILSDLNSEYDIIMNNHIDYFIKYQDLHLHIYDESKGKSDYDSQKNYNFLLWDHRYNMFFKEKYYESLSKITNIEIHKALKDYINQEKITNTTIVDWNKHRQENLRSFLNKHNINDTDAIFNDSSKGMASIINNNNLINHAKLKEQYGTAELDQLLFNIRFKTTWTFQNLVWLKENNRQFKKVVINELKHHNLTSWQSKEANWQDIDNYKQKIKEADEYYNLKEYKKSVIAYAQAFEYSYTDQLDIYNAACSSALAEDIETAFQYLFKLANSQFKYADLKWITTDSDLDILHKDKRWIDLIKIVKLNKEEAELEK